MKLATLIIAAALALPARSATVDQRLSMAASPDGSAVTVTDVLAGSSSGQQASGNATATFTDPEGGKVITSAATATVSVGAGSPIAIPKVTVSIKTPPTWTLAGNPVITGLANETHAYSAGTMTVTGDLGVSGATVSYQLQVHL